VELDADKVLLHAIQDGIREGIKSKMSGYNSPFDKLIADAVAKNGPAMQSVLADAIASCLGDTEFRANIAEQVRSQLAKQLIQKFGGELEKAVNQLKSDPATRARITLAVEQIVAKA